MNSLKPYQHCSLDISTLYFHDVQIKRHFLTLSTSKFFSLLSIFNTIIPNVDDSTIINIKNNKFIVNILSGVLTVDTSSLLSLQDTSLVNIGFLSNFLHNNIYGEYVHLFLDVYNNIVVFNTEQGRLINKYTINTYNLATNIKKIDTDSLPILKNKISSTNIELRKNLVNDYGEHILSTGGKGRTIKNPLIDRDPFDCYYIINIDKYNNKIITIDRYLLDGMIYYTDFLNNEEYIQENIISLKVNELFPIKKGTSFSSIIINVYKEKSNYFVKSTSDDLFDFHYTIKAEIVVQNKELDNIYNNISSKLNQFKFTVKSPNKSFKDELFTFLSTLPINNSSSDLKIKQYHFSLDFNDQTFSISQEKSEEIKQLIPDFFTLKITNGNDFTFNFFNIGQQEFFTNKLQTLEIKEIMQSYFKFYNNKETMYKKISILKQCIQFIKNKNLYPHTKIKNVSFVNNIKFLKKELKRYHIIKWKSNNKEGVYELFTIKEDNNYTSKIKSKIAKIPFPKSIINNTLKDKNILFNQLDDNQKKEILEHNIKPLLNQNVKFLIFKKDTSFYLRIPFSYANKNGIKIDAKNVLLFKEEIDIKSNNINFKEGSFREKINLYNSLIETSSSKDSKSLTTIQIHISKNEIKNLKNSLYNLLIKDTNSVLDDIVNNLHLSKDEKWLKTIDEKLEILTIHIKRLAYATPVFVVDKLGDNFQKNYTTIIKEIKRGLKNSYIEKDSIIKKIDDLYIDITNRINTLLVDSKITPSIKQHYKNIEKIEIQSQQINLHYNINRWDTTNKKILNKYKSQKKYYYTFDTETTDIVKNITDYSKFFNLIHISDSNLNKRLISKSFDKETSGTKKKLESFISSNPNITKFNLISEEEVKNILTDLLT